MIRNSSIIVGIARKHNLAPADLDAGKLLKLMVSKIHESQGTTIEMLLPPKLGQAVKRHSVKTIGENLESCKDAAIHEQTLQEITAVID